MENLLTYVLQVNLLLIIVYLGYHYLLKGLTFYMINRVYFYVGVVYSFLYPFLDVKSLFHKHVEPIGEYMYFMPDLSVYEFSVFSLSNILLFVSSIGVVFFVMKLLIQLVSLLRIHLRSEPAVWQSFLYRNVFFPIVPFSFFNRIYVNKSQHKEDELGDIFKHEDIHVKGYHSFDILFFELVLIMCWYNPVAWLMRKAVRQNLEFLTDQQVLNKGVDRQMYQYSLLNVNKQGVNASIANQFNFKMLKQRIMMMNKKRSSKVQLSKYALLIPVFVFVAGAFTVSKADDKITEVVNFATTTDVLSTSKKMFKQEVTAPEIVEESKENVASSTTSASDTVKLKGRVLGIHVDSLRGKNVLYIVDGEKVSSSIVSVLDKSRIASISVLKDASATALYGEGVDGVIIITTKKDSSLPDNVSRIRIRGSASTDPSKDPIIIVDGVKSGDFGIKNLRPDDIESITVLKGVDALQYEADAKNGVILIKTKKDGKADTTSSVRKLHLSNESNVVYAQRNDDKVKEIVVTGYYAPSDNSNESSNKEVVIVGRKSTTAKVLKGEPLDEVIVRGYGTKKVNEEKKATDFKEIEYVTITATGSGKVEKKAENKK